MWSNWGYLSSNSLWADYGYAFMSTDFNQFWYSGEDLTYILACLSSVVRKMTAYQLNKYDVNAFVELFDMCM